ncbi:nuclear transport factor 2 family protein [Hyphobacterium sp.]|uniref:nuclear transport factor 2 family protein n=1 Tax=Hyphobacterium sp. TaxID=2004662 RepID=UPI003BA9C70D
MTDIPAALDHMMAAWNETDPDKVRGHLDKALAPEVVFADPDNYIVGIDEFEAMVHAFRKRIPDARAKRTTGFNEQNRRYRYEWLVSSGDTPLMPGMDVTELNADGKVVRVDGFFGPIPALD